MTERRFNEAEVGAILGRAANTDRATGEPGSARDGLTLAQLEDIGREVGISAAIIRESAAVVGRVGLATTRSFLGLPLGVGRTVELERKLSDAEWERFVVDLRETFDARGTLRNDGSLRQWSNGNLQALLEPTASGHRVRLRTSRQQSRMLMMTGLAALGVSAATFVGAAMAGIATDPEKLSSMGMMAVIGTSIFGLGAFRLPGWARARRQQMEALAERLATGAFRADDQSAE